MRLQLSIPALALLLIAAAPPEVETKAKKLMVHTLRSNGQLDEAAQRLTERITAHVATLGKQRGLVVMSEGDVALAMGFLKDAASLSFEECKRAEGCIAKIREATDAGLILGGRVDKFSDSYVGILSLIDTEQSATVASRSCAAADWNELTAVMLKTSAEILGLDAGAPTLKLEQPISSENKKIGVIPLTGIPEEPAIASYLSENLAVELLKFGFSVVTQADQITLLRDAAERHAIQKRDQPLDQFLVEIAGAMGVDYLVSGVVERLAPDHFVVVLKLLDINQGVAVHRIAEDVRGELSQLPIALRFTTAALLGRDISGEGAVALVTDVEGQFRIDQNAAEPLPRSKPITGLRAAKHDLHISADGYKPYFGHFYIDPTGEQTRFTPQLEETDPEWYESVWFWSIAGVVVAGATTVTLLATIPPTGVGVGDEF